MEEGGAFGGPAWGGETISGREWLRQERERQVRRVLALIEKANSQELTQEEEMEVGAFFTRYQDREFREEVWEILEAEKMPQEGGFRVIQGGRGGEDPPDAA